MGSFAYDIRTHGAQSVGARERERFTLRPSADGWALVAPDGSLVFHAPGSRGRRRCLQFARAHGVLAIFT